MSCHPAFSGPVAPQSQSKLLRLPAEIRRAIYAYAFKVHAFVSNDRVHFSPCVEVASSHDDGSERQVTGQMRTDEKWARRLQSSWGPHWRCHEICLSPDRGSLGSFALLLTCKMLHQDLLAYMQDDASFNLTDLHTLDHLIQNAKLSFPGPPSSLSAFLTPLFLKIKRLDITLRFPMALCQGMEMWPNRDFLNPAGDCLEQLRTWRRLPEIIAQFKQLKELHIWVDHDQALSWVVVNERILLSPLLPLTRNKKLNLCVTLPQLHPDYQNYDWQYSPGGPPAEFTIHRRRRQRYYSCHYPNCLLPIGYELNFPAWQGFEEEGEKSTAQLAVEEREMWLLGGDFRWADTTEIPVCLG